MESSRRTFLKLAGISALGLGAKPVLDALAASGGGQGKPMVMQGEDALIAKRWALVIDTRKFEPEEDLEPMIEVCHKIHNVPKLENKRN